MMGANPFVPKRESIMQSVDMQALSLFIHAMKLDCSDVDIAKFKLHELTVEGYTVVHYREDDILVELTCVYIAHHAEWFVSAVAYPGGKGN